MRSIESKSSRIGKFHIDSFHLAIFQVEHVRPKLGHGIGIAVGPDDEFPEGLVALAQLVKYVHEIIRESINRDESKTYSHNQPVVYSCPSSASLSRECRTPI